MIQHVHSIAILKGTVEGDPHLHLASLMGAEEHSTVLLRAGLLAADNDNMFTATEAGVKFYETYNLESLPAGRANAWTGNHEAANQLTRASAALSALLA